MSWLHMYEACVHGDIHVYTCQFGDNPAAFAFGEWSSNEFIEAAADLHERDREEIELIPENVKRGWVNFGHPIGFQFGVHPLVLVEKPEQFSGFLYAYCTYLMARKPEQDGDGPAARSGIST